PRLARMPLRGAALRNWGGCVEAPAPHLRQRTFRCTTSDRSTRQFTRMTLAPTAAPAKTSALSSCRPHAHARPSVSTRQAATAGTIAGVPETHKSFLAQAIAVAVARGEGEILGHPVVDRGSVGYVWQDDSRREEAERVKLYERVHGDGSDLPLRWFLNEGVV